MRQPHAKGLGAISGFDNWHLLIQGPIKGFAYKLSCKFQYEPLDFIVKFGTKYTTFRKMFYD
jgi:hypothetical protein